MSLNSPAKPARTRSYWTDADVEDQIFEIYTCPPNCRAEVTMLHIVNANGNTTVDAYWYVAPENIPYYKSSHADYSTWIVDGYRGRILGGKNLIGGEYVLLTGATLVIEPGDRIEVKASGNASPHIDARCTVIETFIPVG